MSQVGTYDTVHLRTHTTQDGRPTPCCSGPSTPIAARAHSYSGTSATIAARGLVQNSVISVLALTFLLRDLSHDSSARFSTEPRYHCTHTVTTQDGRPTPCCSGPSTPIAAHSLVQNSVINGRPTHSYSGTSATIAARSLVQNSRISVPYTPYTRRAADILIPLAQRLNKSQALSINYSTRQSIYIGCSVIHELLHFGHSTRLRENKRTKVQVEQTTHVVDRHLINIPETVRSEVAGLLNSAIASDSTLFIKHTSTTLRALGIGTK
ncbi:hypothetical protein J6590_029382 [Homalodisca vitripennis]|nr:hypothetical protein J6590_029382 [Homalodisca vitripennis]